MKRLIVLASLLGFSSVQAAVETYTIDPVHSSVGFSIRHFVSKVPGRFTKFSGTITVDRDNLENSSVEASIDVGSINTASERRDNDLKGAAFFDAEKFATITFKSKVWKKTGADTFDVTGDLTIKDVTKEVGLNVTLLGFGPGSRGAMLSGWEAVTTIKKADFNVKGPAMLAAALGDDGAGHIGVEAGLKQ